MARKMYTDFRGSGSDFKCRICGSINGIRLLFQSDMVQARQMLTTLANVSVKPDDLLPKCICNICTAKLTEAYKFKMLCEQSDQDHRQRLGIATSPVFRKDNIVEGQGAVLASLYECRKCKLCFAEAAMLQKHFETHNKFSCQTCGQKFPDQLALKTHEALHLICNSCGKLSANQAAHLEHINTHALQVAPINAVKIPSNIDRKRKIDFASSISNQKQFKETLVVPNEPSTENMSSSQFLSPPQPQPVLLIKPSTVISTTPLNIPPKNQPLMKQLLEKFKCSFCGLCFDRLSELNPHLITHFNKDSDSHNQDQVVEDETIDSMCNSDSLQSKMNENDQANRTPSEKPSLPAFKGNCSKEKILAEKENLSSEFAAKESIVEEINGKTFHAKDGADGLTGDYHSSSQLKVKTEVNSEMQSTTNMSPGTKLADKSIISNEKALTPVKSEPAEAKEEESSEEDHSKVLENKAKQQSTSVSKIKDNELSIQEALNQSEKTEKLQPASDIEMNDDHSSTQKDSGELENTVKQESASDSVIKENNSRTQEATETLHGDKKLQAGTAESVTTELHDSKELERT